MFWQINWEHKNQPGLETIELQLMLGLDISNDDNNKAVENKKTESEAVKKAGKYIFWYQYHV